MKIKYIFLLSILVILFLQSAVKADDGCLIYPYCGQPLTPSSPVVIHLPIIVR